ncbi:glycoside hydrolase family 25 protein [Ferruginibacter lapsinanis]|uniref:glycoside hydrolase family 25 protein n=1 Tax=Ferruginibacter lapsinanis TaxID=563172 RepID=UPI001E3F0492|nr:GH25 family lysozyme [Ferruginibacter lapsinanis]UEG50642.1 glycoside hydrolase family 25 protein [Ferruginibacter lapsinanis]
MSTENRSIDNKNRILIRWPIIILLALMILAWMAFYLFGEKRIVRYTSFGIDLPVNYSMHGIDISHYQSDIDWEEVKQMQIDNIKIGFCFIKATEGIERTDDRFETNWGKAKANNIPRGAYHFFDSENDGVEQARNFIENVQLAKGDLPPVLDVEQLNGVSIADLQRRVSDWLKMVEIHYKVKPIIYTGADFYKRCLADKFSDYPLWVAHYLVKDKPRIERSWLFWQHNDAGHVNGIDAYVDFNVFNGDSAAFKQLLLK